MFIGHYAPAFAATAMIAKRQEKTSPQKTTAWLGTMFIAAQLVDFGFFGLVLANIEKMRITPGISVMVPFDLYYMPYTHSLVGTIIWSAGFAAIIMLFSRNAFAAAMGFLVVLSHWFLDLLVHVQDLTITGSPPKIGLGLWDHPLIEMPLEIGIISVAFIWYLRSARPTGKFAILSASILAGLLLLLQAVNWFGGHPEEFEPSIAWTGLIAFTLLAMAAHWTAKQRMA